LSTFKFSNITLLDSPYRAPIYITFIDFLEKLFLRCDSIGCIDILIIITYKINYLNSYYCI